MRFELFVATRYLRAKRRQAFIGVITAISILGVAAGVASLIVALAINNGFRQDLQQRLLGSTSHVSLLRVQSDGIKDWPALMERLSQEPHVVAARACDLRAGVDLARAARPGRGAEGMIPAYERKVSDLLSTVKIGSADTLEETSGGAASELDSTIDNKSTSRAAGEGARATSEPTSTAADRSVRPTTADSLARVHERVAAMPPIILGKDMAEELGASVGSVVLVTSPQGELTPFGMVPKYNRFRVVGIFNSGFFDYDTSWAFTRLSDAQRSIRAGRPDLGDPVQGR